MSDTVESLKAKLANRDKLIKDLHDYVFELTNKAFRKRPEMEIVIGGSEARDARLSLSLLHDLVTVSLQPIEEIEHPLATGYHQPPKLRHVRLTVDIETDDGDGRVTNLCRALQACGAGVRRG